MFPDYDVFISPGVRLSDGVTARLSGGVACLTKKHLKGLIEELKIEQDNTIALMVQGKLFNSETPTVLIGTYIPPAFSKYYAEIDIQNGVSMLEQCLLDISEEHEQVSYILLGDLNARTSSENSKDFDITNIPQCVFASGDVCETKNPRISKDEKMNDYGRHLLTVCEEFDLTILNGAVPNNSSSNYTYISTSGCSVNDYAIVSRSLLSLSTFEMNICHRIESKHAPIELYVNKPQKEQNTSAKPKTYKVEKFIWDPEKQEDFNKAVTDTNVTNILAEACTLVDVNVNAAVDKFQEAVCIAGECMKKSFTMGGIRKQAWFDRECREQRTSLRKVLRKFDNDNMDTDRIQYNQKRREYKELLRNKRHSHRQNIVNALNNAGNNPTEFWGKLRSYLGKKVQSNTILAQEWFDYFKNLFNNLVNNNENENLAMGNPDGDVLEIRDDDEDLNADITQDEIYDAIRSLKNNKAAGPDCLIGEFFKNAPGSFVPFLCKLYNKLFSTGTYPVSWTESIIQPLHKKGDVNKTDNYRGISLLNINSKIYSHILNKRLNVWTEKHNIIHESQAGFRKKYSTIDHIFTVCALVNKQLSYHKKLYVAFIDFRKAFDSVVHEKLWHVLRKNGLHGKMYGAITSMYDVVKARVRAGGDLTEAFVCPLGVKQGEICSPALFSLFINELAKEIVLKGRHGIQMMPDLMEIFILMFADDIILMSDSVGGLQNQLNVLYNMSRKLSLVVNLDKSDIVVFRNGGHVAESERWVYGASGMKVVNVYKYLGIFLSTRLSFSHTLQDFATRAKKGTIAILRLIWSLGEKSPQVFFKLFDVQIQPMINYGAEIWGVEADLTVVERVHLFAIKRFLNVSIRTPNVLVYGETGRYPLQINIHVKCIRYWLRLLKMSTHRLPHKAYKMLLHMHGNNRNTWASSICYLLYKHGFDEVWENQGVGNESLFITTFKERLIGMYKRDWQAEVDNKDRYLFYRSFKSELMLSPYLQELKHIKARNSLVRLRLGVSQLKTHKLRFYTGTNVDLSCPFCQHVDESEVHFVLVCPKYQDIRDDYLPRKFYANPNLHRLSILLASTNKSIMIRTAKYLMEAFARRNTDMLMLQSRD